MPCCLCYDNKQMKIINFQHQIGLLRICILEHLNMLWISTKVWTLRPKELWMQGNNKSWLKIEVSCLMSLDFGSSKELAT
jgi:hypothetical protein